MLKGPRVHLFVPPPSAPLVADGLLALGARPTMSEEPSDLESFLEDSRALCLNLGMATQARGEVMLQAALKARELSLPLVLDPAGVSVSPFRIDLAYRLLETGALSVLRGNRSEMEALLRRRPLGGGVDAAESQSDDARFQEQVKAWAERWNCVCSVSGATDWIVDASQCQILTGGSPLAARLTGMGCLSGGVVAACAADSSPYEAACRAAAAMKRAQERAAARCSANDVGTFKAAFLDALALEGKK